VTVMAGGNGQRGRSVASKLACILAEFNADRVRLRASEVCRHTGMPFSTVHRLLTELVEQELLEHLPDGTYAVGVKLWQIAAPQPEVSRLRHAALSAMHGLTVTLQSCVRLNMLVGAEGLCVEELCAAHDPRTRHGFGIRFALHSAAGGHVLLAYAGQQVQQRVLSAPPARRSATPSPWMRELARIRRNGVAMSRDDAHLSVSVPIFDDTAGPIASLEVLTALPADPIRLITPVRLAGEQVSRTAALRPHSACG
jgi:DNA-binding IclR family transcriptional regulator